MKINIEGIEIDISDDNPLDSKKIFQEILDRYIGENKFFSLMNPVEQSLIKLMFYSGAYTVFSISRSLYEMPDEKTQVEQMDRLYKHVCEYISDIIK